MKSISRRNFGKTMAMGAMGGLAAGSAVPVVEGQAASIQSPKRMSDDNAIVEISRGWDSDERWKGIQRPYSAKDVVRLRGSVQIDHTLAMMGAERLWHLVHTEPYAQMTAATSGMQAVFMVQAGLKVINVSGNGVAAEGNDAGDMYPDEGLYPVGSVPHVIRKINNSLRRADQISHAAGQHDVDWMVPIKGDAEAGWGGDLNAFEVMKSMIEAGAATVSFEDQPASTKKCGHFGGKVLVPTREHIRKLIAARLAADVMGVPTLIIARTDAKDSPLITTDIDPRDHPFLTGKRTSEGFFRTRGGLDVVIARGLAYAPFADMLWFETNEPTLEEARKFADAIHAKFPEKLLYYNCSSSFNWSKMLDDASIARFQSDLGTMGYKIQNCTGVGINSMYLSLFKTVRRYRETGMPALASVQQDQRDTIKDGYKGWKSQEFVGAEYFDDVAETIAGAALSTGAMSGSTEETQF